MPLVGWILVIMAAVSVIGVLIIVMREQHEHEEAYTPPSGSASERQQLEDSGE